MYRPVLVTPPSVVPVSLAEVKAHVRAQDFTDDDATLTALIAAAVSHLDGWTGILGRCLGEQTWRQDFDRFARCLRLPLAPVISITSVKYDDADDVEQTVAGASYTLQNDDLGPYVEFITTFSYPSLHVERPALRVAYKAGYANAGSEPDFTSTVPDAIKQAILLLVGHWYEHRETVLVGASAAAVELPLAVNALIAPFRRIRF